MGRISSANLRDFAAIAGHAQSQGIKEHTLRGVILRPISEVWEEIARFDNTHRDEDMARTEKAEVAVLVLRKLTRLTDPWENAGGKRERAGEIRQADEPLHEVLTREVPEETGLQVTQIGQLLAVQVFRNNRGLAVVESSFRVDVAYEGKTTITLTEHTALRWLPLTDNPGFGLEGQGIIDRSRYAISQAYSLTKVLPLQPIFRSLTAA